MRKEKPRKATNHKRSESEGGDETNARREEQNREISRRRLADRGGDGGSARNIRGEGPERAYAKGGCRVRLPLVAVGVLGHLNHVVHVAAVGGRHFSIAPSNI